jgi:hypothetical protein
MRLAGAPRLRDASSRRTEVRAMQADNLVTLVMEQLGPSVLGKIGASLGVGTDTARTAVGSAVPALLAGIAGLASRPEGAAQLNAALQQQDLRQGDDPSSLLDAAARPGAAEEGRSLLSSLLGGSATAGLTNALAKSTGISQGAIATLLGLLGPVVMGVLRRYQRSERLDAGGLANVLTAQTGNIAAALPSGLAGLLRGSGMLDSLGDTVGQGARAANAAVGAAGEARAMMGNLPGAVAAAPSGRALPGTQGRGGLPMLVLGAAVLLAIALVGYWLSGSPEAPTTARQGAEPPAAAATGSLAVGQVDVGKELSGAVDTATSALQSVTDAASAHGAVPRLEDAAAQIDKLGGLAAQLPAAAKQTLAQMIAKLQPGLQAAADKVATVPDAADVLKPALDALMAKLDALRAA